MIGVVVAIVPSGLPAFITLKFPLIAKKMFHHNVLVKNVSTVETLGSVSVFANDKTDTLNQNKMSSFYALFVFKHGEEVRQLYNQFNTTAICLMIYTSDHPSTALSIARMVDVLSNKHVYFHYL
jgi:magnesium-transporting ATPase (P-type)